MGVQIAPRLDLPDIYPNYGREVAAEKGLARFIYKILPRHTAIPLRNELYLAWVRARGRKVKAQYRGARELLVNIGAGTQGLPGWVNIEMMQQPGVNCVYDCRKSLPFPDGSVKGIFCEHFFEHLDYTEEVPYFLSECLRVLQPGGVIRIVVPDTKKYIEAYLEPGWETLGRIRPLEASRVDTWCKCSYNTKMELINMVFRQGHEHKYAYDYATLELNLHRYGFAAVHLQEFGRSMMNDLCIDWSARASESLYVEAVK